MRWFVLLSIFALSFVAAVAPAQDKKQPKLDKKNYLLVVPPSGGKEVKLVDWRFTLGTRHFSTSAKAKADDGPEYLEFREEKSTTYKNGIVTLIPLSSLRKIQYDRDKKTVTVVAIKAGGEDVTLVGNTKFTANKIIIEGETILDGLGAATVKFHGGIAKGLQSVAFPAPKPADKATGAAATVIADDKEKTKHAVSDVQALYLSGGQYRMLPYLMFKKTVKVDLDKLAGLRYVPPMDKKKASSDYEITLKDGTKHTLSLLSTIDVDKKKMTFLGLVGRVPVGYKLFMLDAIYEYRLDASPKE